MGGDSRSEGRGFESQHHILEGHFFTLICCKILLMFVWKRPKINEKESGDGPFKKIRFLYNKVTQWGFHTGMCGSFRLDTVWCGIHSCPCICSFWIFPISADTQLCHACHSIKHSLAEWAFKVVHLNLLKCSMKKLKIVCSWYLSLISCLKTINCHIDNAWIRTGVLWRQMRPLLQLCHSKCLQQHRQQLAIVLSQQKITPHKVITCS